MNTPQLLKLCTLISLMTATPHLSTAQSVIHYQTTPSATWTRQSARLSSTPAATVVATATPTSQGTPFSAWGTTFNELDLDAFNLLSTEEQNTVMFNLYSPQGDLHFTHGRISMNANDYARSWYSCSDIPGDFQLRYFNIEHDKQNIIKLAKAAQQHYPQLQLFMSPWSPPTWMKINNDYCVLSSQYNKQSPQLDYLLYDDTSTGRTTVDPDEMKLLGDRNEVFPRRLATQDYFIQDPRYLQCYADMFCKFIDLYKAEGLPITKVMYQNEAYSYTPYPGCPWTAEGTIRFNNEYLAPTLKRHHPDVQLWLGTINTNRLDYVMKTLDDPTLQQNITGIGTQWECRNNLPQLRQRYPHLRLMMSESECGNGSMDWKAGEHTFFLIADNLGHGVDEYYNWNFILTDNGKSTWGWTQNALIQVDSKTRQMRYTPEYYAYKHFSHFVDKGTKMVSYSGRAYSRTPVNVFLKDGGHYIVTAANFTDEPTALSVQLGKKYLNLNLQPHSFHTYVMNK